ncbi:MAG TPA: hypothetical protein VLL52_20590 [Anaerolineae bacterium]|nr:hypothetical protein [Anaerolineae bacterium]
MRKNNIIALVTDKPEQRLGIIWQSLVGYDVGLCLLPAQLQQHLTVREQLLLTARLHGGGVEALSGVPFGLADYFGTRIQALPYSVQYTVCLADGLLSGAEGLLLLNLGKRLGAAAQKVLWQQIRFAQSLGRTIFLATDDIQAVRALADEVWWLGDEGDVRRRAAVKDLPASWHEAMRYGLTCQNVRLANYWLAKIKNDFKPVTCEILPATPNIIYVTCREKDDLWHLLRVMGRAVSRFETLSIDLADMMSEVEVEQAVEPIELVDREPMEEGSKGALAQNGWVVVRNLALVEWRRHFRSFWRGGNLLFSMIYSLGILELLFVSIDLFETEKWYLITGAIALLLPLGLVGWGVEAFFRWLDMPAGTFSLVQYYQLWPIPARRLWLGLYSGHLLVLMTHSVVLFLFWLLIFYYDPIFLLISAVFWLWWVLISLLTATFIATWVRKRVTAIIGGWFIMIMLYLGTVYFVQREHILSFVWPHMSALRAFAEMNYAFYQGEWVIFSVVSVMMMAVLGWGTKERIVDHLFERNNDNA